MHRLFLSLGLVIFLVACGKPSQADIDAAVQTALAGTAESVTGAATATAEAACSPDALKAYATMMDGYIQKIRDQTAVAGSTPRIGLGAQLQALLDLQYTIADVPHAACVEEVHASVVALVATYRESFQAFSLQQEQQSFNLTSEATARLIAVQKALATLHNGQIPEIAATPTPIP